MTPLPVTYLGLHMKNTGYTNLSYYSETYFSCLGNLFLLLIGIFAVVASRVE